MNGYNFSSNNVSLNLTVGEIAISNISIGEAKHLYVQLKQIFEPINCNMPFMDPRIGNAAIGPRGQHSPFNNYNSFNPNNFASNLNNISNEIKSNLIDMPDPVYYDIMPVTIKYNSGIEKDDIETFHKSTKGRKHLFKSTSLVDKVNDVDNVVLNVLKQNLEEQVFNGKTIFKTFKVEVVMILNTHELLINAKTNTNEISLILKSDNNLLGFNREDPYFLLWTNRDKLFLVRQDLYTSYGITE